MRADMPAIGPQNHSLPVAHAQLQGAAFDVPMHSDMTQLPDRAVVEHRLGA